MAEKRKIIPGVEVEISGEKYTLPPLTLGQLRGGVLEKIKKNDELMQGGKFWESLDVKAEIIGEALRRNYPDLSNDDISGMVDLRNWDKLWEIVLGGSGLRSDAARRESEEGISSPNPTAALGNGISDLSTDALSEPTTGPTEKSTTTH